MTAERQTRLLVVEDEPATRRVLLISLRSLGFEVLTASDGREALSIVDAYDPDVIMLDLLMPVMDGFEFMRMYKGKVPIVVMSGWGDLKELPRAVFATVVKPAGMSEVAPILRDAAKSWRV